MNSIKTVLIYVLSSHNPPYGEMVKTAMETWDAEPLEGTRTVYYCGNPVGGDTDRVISFPVEEDLNTIGRKNIMAYRRALEWPWDFMARTSQSTYVHKGRLLARIQTLPDRGLIQGIQAAPTWVCGVNRPFLWGGGQFIFTRDTVQMLVANAFKWRHDLMEDVSTSELAQDCGFALNNKGIACSIDKQTDGWLLISSNGKPGFEFTDFAELSTKAEDQFFFRCKYDPDRTVDAEIMRCLKKNLPS